MLCKGHLFAYKSPSFEITDCDTLTLPVGGVESEVLPLPPAAIILNGAVMASSSH